MSDCKCEFLMQHPGETVCPFCGEEGNVIVAGAITCRCGFVELDPGETCPYCGFGQEVEKFYYFSEKTKAWIECRTESFCRRKAEEGFKVKMVKVKQ